MSPPAPDATEILPGLPPSARLWVFGVNRSLTSEEETRFLGAVDAFLATWQAHGAPLAAARDWRHGRFLLVGVDERIAPPSGCSIDALVRIIRGLESELGVQLLGGGAVWYRDGADPGTPVRVDREAFRELAARGEVSHDTIVFDLSVTRVHEAREGKWEKPARESWHSRFWPTEAPASD